MGVILGAGAIGAGGALGGSIFSGIMSAAGAQKQANAIKYASEQAKATALELNNRSRADLQPFRDLGVQSGKMLGDIFSGKANISDTYKASSLYNFQSELGTRALDRQLSARGMSGSGAGLESLALFDKSLVAEEGNRYFDKLFSTTQLGSNAAAQQASNTTSTGNTLAQIGAQAGIAQGGAIANQYNAYGSIGQGIGNAFQGAATNYSNYSLYNPLIQSQIARNNAQAGNTPQNNFTRGIGQGEASFSLFNP